LCKGIDDALKALGVQIQQFQEEASPRRGLYGAVGVEPLEDMLHCADGLHPPGP